jgi:hypothetical protein
VILSMVAGKRYFSTNAVADEESRRIQKLVREFFCYIGMFVVSDTIPYLGWLDLGGHEKGMKKVAKDIAGYDEQVACVVSI